jgi:hypothetical protein
MRLKTFLITSSLLFTGCGVPRPDTNLCVLNTELLYKYCYNMKNDYDDNGHLNKNAHPVKKLYPSKEAMMVDLHKNIAVDPDGFGNLKAYVSELIRQSN